MKSDAEKIKGIVTLEKDGTYFRVIIKFDTHKLHSEKLNLESAFDLGNTIKEWTEQ